MAQRPFDDPEAARQFIAQCLAVLRGQRREVGAAAIGQALGGSASTVRGYLTGSTDSVPVGFCVELGRLAQIPAHDVLRALGLLPPGLPETPASSVPGAPLRAVEALLHDPEGAERFATRVFRISSGLRYRCPSHEVAHFTLRSGHTPLPYDEAERLARLAAVEGRPLAEELHRDREYWSLRLELRARVETALRSAGEHSWQGDPGTDLWDRLRTEDGRAPQVLVQDPVAATSTAPVADPDGSLPTLLFVGGRQLIGTAAALLAQALGRQYVLVRSLTEVAQGGSLVPVRRDLVGGRTTAWTSAAAHIREQALAGTPWAAVVLVRPYVFSAEDGLDDAALDHLRHTPARIVFCRPSAAMLAWWAKRQERTAGRFRYHRPARRAETARVLDAVAAVLGERARDDDLTVRLPEPHKERDEGTEQEFGAEFPAAVADLQPRIAWWVLRRLSETDPGRLPRQLVPTSRLAQWSELLAADPRALRPAPL
ncbi:MULTISPECIES: hypothetical protein [unclassified Streptomyces]|uniref:hypothetical protein n=1 Tax=unclassified Streptomyces TaxID=2593676 RepID=UPI001F04519B|nr:MULTISPECIES: hypothetical protein [unclassified Streptomyces]MCH0564893.1 hypothetical protein [Streptomyces sp. MUM 2J]MCH0571076.1 hypothetical protein [Streptomyces sp. MUM 136J]